MAGNRAEDKALQKIPKAMYVHGTCNDLGGMWYVESNGHPASVRVYVS